MGRRAQHDHDGESPARKRRIDLWRDRYGGYIEAALLIIAGVIVALLIARAEFGWPG